VSGARVSGESASDDRLGLEARARSPAEVVVAWAADSTIVAVSQAVSVIADHPAADLIGRPADDLLMGVDDIEPSTRPDRTTEFRVRARTGASRWIEGTMESSPAIAGLTIFRGRDITGQRAADEVLQEFAYTDSMTALPNRAGFLRLLADGLKEEHIAGLLFVDLDAFKTINDSLGHTLGDLLLVEVVGRLRAIIMASDVLGRLGGDEFGVAVAGVPGDVEVLEAAAVAVLRALDEPFSMGTRSLAVTASIGVAPAEAGIDFTTLIRRADTAMYKAKAAGKACRVVFDDLHEAAAQRRMELELELQQGLEGGEFFVLYQPEVGLESGRIEVVEALVRWDHPVDGQRGPAGFIDIAEDCGLIVPLGESVLRMACGKAAEWRRRFGVEAPAVSVNVATPQLTQTDFVEVVRKVLAQTGLPPRLLRLELTESMLADPAWAGPLLARLRDLGCSVAIDDFGTGYSSLAYLHTLDVDTLKIDRAFIMEVTDEHSDTPLVAAIIAMARSLGLHVDAEGVETAGQMAYLKRYGCDRVQGFLLGRPMADHQIEALLERAEAAAARRTARPVMDLGAPR